MLLLALVSASLPGMIAPAQAVSADEQLSDPALEVRARNLMREVRCVVCQAQSIGESDAGIAVDLRHLIRAQVAAGASDDQIRQFLVDRYGDFILFKPPFKAETAVLWIGPFVVLLTGFGLLVWFFRRRRTIAAPAALDPEETRRVARALDDSGIADLERGSST
ncbi:MAG: cytochrome c-type biogenesis protein CcmH [Rhodospirillaceae bacterium]|nr:cytochrome c-type biogenesis protein CcmH [Rhodospirillaceae bacterium]